VPISPLEKATDRCTLNEMRRREFFGSSLAAATAFPQSQPSNAAPQRPPNVLLLLYDKCRTDAIRAYEGIKERTPNLNQIAASGVRFNHAYTPQALCAPARASMLTGLYPHAHGIRYNPYPGAAAPTNSNFRDPVIDPFRDARFQLWDNFVYHLSNAGYATGCVGKWHLGPGNPGFFDTFKGFNSLLRHWVGEPHKSPYRPDVETDEGIRFIEANAGRPWFLYQSYYAPHEPLDPPKQWAEKFANQEHADYHATVANLDWNTGRIFETLRRHSLLDNTLIIFASDHGRSWIDRPGSSEERIALSYEEVARVPLIMRYPARLPGGKVWDSGVTLAALSPTILEACNITLTRGLPGHDQTPKLHAVSLFQTLSGGDTWAEPVVVQNIPQATIDGSFFDERAIRTARYKLILRKYAQMPALRPGELYDLQSDPGERINLYGGQPQAIARLAKQLESWAVRTGDDTAVQLARFAHGQ